MAIAKRSGFYISWAYIFLLSLLIFPITGQRGEGKHQLLPNRLRDAAAVGDHPKAPARYAPAILSRTVTTPWKVWAEVDDFTRLILSSPQLLDYYVATVETRVKKHDTVIVHAGFSCLDRGKSSAIPIYFWVTEDFGFLTDLKNATGGADSGRPGEASTTDITSQCWEGRHPIPGLRFVEHAGFHRGEGEAFVKKVFNPTETVVDNNMIFDSIRSVRSKHSSHNEVIYHPELKLPIVFELPFMTGMRVYVPELQSETQNRTLHVPFTPSVSIRRHFGSVLQSSNLAPGQSRTNSLIVVMSLLSVGLALILATWIVAKFVTDSIVNSVNELRSEGVNRVVEGIRRIDPSQTMFLILQLLAVFILIAPLILAIAVGDADPFPAVEVTSGVSIMYGPVHENLSDQPSNQYAGAPYHTVVFLSYRNVDDGYYLEFCLSLICVGLVSVYVFILESRRASETIPPHHRSFHFFTLWWKILGAWKIYLKKAIYRDRTRLFKVLVEFHENMHWDAAAMEVLLVADIEFRKWNNSGYRHVYEANLRRAGDELLHHFEEDGRDLSFQLLGYVRMNNEQRYEAMLSGTRKWFTWLRWVYTMPRQWYRITSFEGEDANAIEYYRTHGEFMPDRFLIAAQLGLIPYLDRVRRITIVSDEDEAQEAGHSPHKYNSDDVNVGAIVMTRGDREAEGEMSARALGGSVEVRELRAGDNHPAILAGHLPWGGEHSELDHFSSERLVFVAQSQDRVPIKYCYLQR